MNKINKYYRYVKFILYKQLQVNFKFNIRELPSQQLVLIMCCKMRNKCNANKSSDKYILLI